MANKKELNIYIDESGDCSPYTEYNPLYSVAFIMVDNAKLNNYALQTFYYHLSNCEGGDHFVHTGNLVRAEKPYKNMLRENRQKLFYSLFLFAKHSKYKACFVNVVKKNDNSLFFEALSKSIYEIVIKYDYYFSKYNEIILHYDDGQDLLRDLLVSSFKTHFENVTLVKTLQQDSVYMQVADLYSYFELIKYKVSLNNLSKSEIAFFGTARKIRKNYIEQLKDKYL